MSAAFEDLLREGEVPDLAGLQDALGGLGGDDDQLADMLKGMMGGEDFVPMMQNMMDSLFTKDVMYPSLTEIGSKVCKNSVFMG